MNVNDCIWNIKQIYYMANTLYFRASIAQIKSYITIYMQTSHLKTLRRKKYNAGLLLINLALKSCKLILNTLNVFTFRKC